jgi:hypothetical protein
MSYIISNEQIKSNQIKKENVTFSAIYFLLKENKIVYIGQTTRGINRIETHIKEKEKIFDSYSIFPTEKKLLDKIELENILYYKPIYNKEYFNKSDLTINTINTICYKKFGTKNKKIIKKIITDLTIQRYTNNSDVSQIEYINKNDIDIILSKFKEHFNLK